MPTRRLIIGGARSGKSRFAESLAADATAVDYVATSQGLPDDAEWRARVAAHRARRPAHWRTLETLDVADVLARTSAGLVLVDCLTVWLSRIMDRSGCWPDAPSEGWPPAGPALRSDPDATLASRIDELVQATMATRRDAVFVTNEVGQGLVPSHASGRLFRDEMGVVNARMADACDEVWLVCAGIPLRIKG